MTIKNLQHIPFESIIECFLKAFNNYYVEMPDDIEYYKTRWSQAKVDLKLSYGMFDEDILVGFIINGIDFRNKHLTAYNTGTGVIPNYRGQRIVKQIYDYAIPELQNHGVTKCLLEVITDNSKAIKAYDRIGFRITRTLKCYKGVLNIRERPVQFTEKPMHKKTLEKMSNQITYSWDNHQNSVLPNSKYKLYVINNGKKETGYFIMDASNGYIAQFDIFEKDNKLWTDLFYGIQNMSKSIKINNVDTRLSNKIETLHTFGIENVIDQYEMELLI